MTQIYILQMGDWNYFKIGASDFLKKRIRSLQDGNPIELRLVQAFDIRGEFAYDLENWLHKELTPFRIRGEWYHATKEQLDQAIVEVCEKRLKHRTPFRRTALPPPP